MSRYEVRRYHLSKPARVKIEPRDLQRLQLLWIRVAGCSGKQRMTEIAEVLAQAESIDVSLAHALAWSVYESLLSRGLATDSMEMPHEPLRFFPTELGRAMAREADQELAEQRRSA